METLSPNGHLKPNTWNSRTAPFPFNNRGEVATGDPSPAADPAPAPAPDPSLNNPDPLPDPNPAPAPDPAPDPAPKPDPAPAVKNWYDSLSDDLKNNPVVQKYKTQDEMVKGHLNLQKLVGNERVALPKDENDTVAIEALNKALGVPEEAAGYELEDPTPPEGMEAMAFGMEQFKELAFKHKLTPAQAKGIQEDYVNMLANVHDGVQKTFADQLEATKKELKGEWGLAYDAKVKTAQNVMNKFAGSKENFEYINAKIGADPVALKFLATVGEQFKEGSLGDIGDPVTTFTKTPSEAKAEYDKIMSDPNDVYWAGVRNQNRVPEGLRKERIAYVEDLLRMQHPGNAK